MEYEGMVAEVQLERQVRVYVAGSLLAKDDVRRIVHGFRQGEVEVVSRWHDLPDEVTSADPVEHQKRAELNDMNVADIDRCDVLVAWTMTGRPCTTYCEIGYAVGVGKRVIWAQGAERIGANIFDAHPRVKRLSGKHLTAETCAEVASIYIRYWVESRELVLGAEVSK